MTPELIAKGLEAAAVAAEKWDSKEYGLCVHNMFHYDHYHDNEYG